MSFTPRGRKTLSKGHMPWARRMGRFVGTADFTPYGSLSSVEGPLSRRIKRLYPESMPIGTMPVLPVNEYEERTVWEEKAGS